MKGDTFMAKELVAMLLAGGQGSRLYALTQKLAKPAVPFGGKYRIITETCKTSSTIWWKVQNYRFSTFQLCKFRH